MQVSAGVFFLILGLVGWIWKESVFGGCPSISFVGLGSVIIFFTVILWGRDVAREGSLGKHTTVEMRGLGLGVILFLVSEVVFFISLFWAYFHFALGALGACDSWPCKGIWAPHPLGMPLLETIVLIVSGKGVNWAKNCLMCGRLVESKVSLLMSVLLGFYFLYLQLLEYYWLSFAIWDGVFGSCFYLLTGFHGLHVLIGVFFLLNSLVRMSLFQFSMGHHFGLTVSIWYWHFVDVVWAFVYIFCIVWGYWGSV